MRFSFPSQHRLPAGCRSASSAPSLLHPHRVILSDLSRRLCVPDRVWSTCYLPFLSNAAAWMQRLAIEERDLLSVRLARAVSEVADADGVPPFSEGAGMDTVPLWHYAVVANALCGGVGADLQSLRVLLFEHSGTCRGEWNYLSGAMAPGSIYRSHARPRRKKTIPGVDLWLAHAWLPASGRTWLSSRPSAVRWFLSRMCPAGESVRETVVKKAEVTESATTRPMPAPATKPGSGRAFIDWLRAGLEGRKVTINSERGQVCFVDKGALLLSPGIFILYNPMEWRKAQRAFQRLKWHTRRPDGGDIWSYRFTGSGLKVHGFFVPQTHMPWSMDFEPCSGLTRCESVV